MVICDRINNQSYLNLLETKKEFNIYCKNCEGISSFAELLFSFCEVCLKMTSISQCAFTTFKIRADQKKMAPARVINNEEKPQTFFLSEKNLEFTPAKYNSKLMKSIWGLYNRYSPHNFKKNNENENLYLVFGQQQSYVAALQAISKNIEMENVEDFFKCSASRSL